MTSATTEDRISDLARDAGLSGRTWASFQCDDAVQDYLDRCGAIDVKLQINAWERSYAAGAAERRRVVEKWVERWTTAPEDYDAFGTETLQICGPWNGRTLRRVLIHPVHQGYQADRYGSGLHATWEEDPREIDRRLEETAARERALAAKREAARATSQAWLSSASDADLEDELSSDDEARAPRSEVRAEIRRRRDARDAAVREEEYQRSSDEVSRHQVIVDDGSPSRPGRWGNIPGRPSRVYYAIEISSWPRDAGVATVNEARSGERGRGHRPESIGRLRDVARRLGDGSLRGARAEDVPPAPVLDRIGHDRLKSVHRAEIVGRVVWVGPITLGGEPTILDARGHIVRKKDVRDAILERMAKGEFQ